MRRKIHRIVELPNHYFSDAMVPGNVQMDGDVVRVTIYILVLERHEVVLRGLDEVSFALKKAA